MRNYSLYKFVITSIILILALSVSGWGRCDNRNSVVNSNYPCDGGSVRPNYISTVQRQCDALVSRNNAGTWTNCIPPSKCIITSCPVCYGTSLSSAYIEYTICGSAHEADSVKCVLNPSDPSCCDAHCECDKAGGTWHPNGYCVKDCQTEACCDSLNVPQVAYDSVYVWRNNSCALHWRCESPQAECVAMNGLLVADALLDTTTEGGETNITYKCYYNCGVVIPSDSSKSMVDGNIVLPGSASLISQGIKTPNPFDAIRSEDNGEYTYDFLSPQAEHYLDSIAFTPCVQVLYRCVLDGKYAYYYDNQTAPSGCTNIVKIK